MIALPPGQALAKVENAPFDRRLPTPRAKAVHGMISTSAQLHQGHRRSTMNTKIPLRIPSSLVGLVGLTAVSLWVGADSAALAAPPVVARPVVAKGATGGAAKNRFLGAHPLAGNPGTGYCYIDVPHVHDYVPD